MISPALCRCWLAVQGPASEVARFRRVAEAEPPDPLSFAQLVPVPERLCRASLPRIQTWCMRHWGSRGPPHSSRVTRVTRSSIEYELLTEWRPPLAFVRQLALLFPRMGIELCYVEPGDRLGRVHQRFAQGRCVEGPCRELELPSRRVRTGRVREVIAGDGGIPV